MVASSIFSSGTPGTELCALLTSTSSWPNLDSAAATFRSAVSRSRVTRHRNDLRTPRCEFRSDRLEFCRVATRQHELGASLGKAACDAVTNALGGTRDERYFAEQRTAHKGTSHTRGSE